MDRVIMPDHKMGKVIIVGAGVFGLSAALIISQRWPNLQISIVDKPSRNAPSQDISKIVRIDYNNEPWMIEALEARRRWISGPFAEFQRTVGRIVIHDKDDFSTLLDIDDTRTKLGLPTRQRGDEKLMQDKFPTTNAPPSLTYVSAPDDMIVDWAPCMSKAMERARQACTDSGGIFYESGVETIIKKASHITALVLENGEEINADNAQVVLAVGPWLTQVLATSDIRLPPNERKPVATGLFSYTVQLDKEQAKYFRDKPVVSHNGTGQSFSADPFILHTG
jgi:L-2-hydroxyglutarate oxidase LhgO